MKKTAANFSDSILIVNCPQEAGKKQEECGLNSPYKFSLP